MTTHYLVSLVTSKTMNLLKPIFLDNHATTPVDPRVANVVLEAMTSNYGNANSTDHAFGDAARNIVESARKHVSNLIGTKRARVIFTSGATEAINIVINNICNNGLELKRFVVSPLEHSAVLETCKWWVKQGRLEIEYVDVDTKGRIDLAHLKHLVKQPTDLVAIMAANNEVGNISPIEEIAQICKAAKTRYLCDSTQAAGKIEIAFDDWDLQYCVLSGHKIYGPKGVGALICPKAESLTPLFFGGGQEFGVRSGTLNVPGIAGLGEASRLRMIEMRSDEEEIAILRNRLEELLKAGISRAQVNGDLTNRLAGNLHLSVPGIPNDAVISRIRSSLAISRGATCTSGVEEPSHVLKAMCLGEEEMEGAFRFGIGKFNTRNEIEEAAKIFIDAVRTVQAKIGCSDLERV